MSDEKLTILLICGASLVGLYLVLGMRLVPDDLKLPAVLIIGAVLTGLGIIRRR